MLLCVLSFITASPACRRRVIDDDAAPPDAGETLEPQAPPPAAPPCLRAPGSFAELASRLRPNVVTIFGSNDSHADPSSALPLTAFGQANTSGATIEETTTKALGTGFLLDTDALIVTSHRVVDGGGPFSVRLSDGRRVAAELRGADPDPDVAVLTLEEAVHEALSLSDTARLRPGDWISIIADPFGGEATVTAGVLRFSAATSDPGSAPTILRRFLGVDASIDAANRGGLVVDATGRLVGLAVSAPRAGSSVGLVLPAQQLRRTVSQLAQHGQPARTWIGLWVRPLGAARAAELGVEPPRGMLVTRLASGGPAEEAGLEVDDVIVELGGRPVVSAADLGAIATGSSSEQPLTVLVIREGRPRSLRLRPAPMPQ